MSHDGAIQESLAHGNLPYPGVHHWLNSCFRKLKDLSYRGGGGMKTAEIA